MPDTIGSIWASVVLHAPAVPATLARGWVKEAFQSACQGRRWAFLRRSTTLRTSPARAVVCDAVQGSSTLTGGVFVAADLHRQLRLPLTGLPYTIVALNAGLTEAQIDRPYAGTTVTDASFTIFDGFVFMPADFDGCRTLTNLVHLRPMPWWFSSEDLDARDPQRQWTDTTARLIASHTVWQLGSLAGRFVYEWWPGPTGAGAYPFTYYARLDPSEDYVLEGPLAGRGHVLETGALALAALWPGTPEQRNPYFNLALAERLDRQFDTQIQELSVRDDDLLPGEQYNHVDWRWVTGQIPLDTQMLRSSDATLADYHPGL